MDESEKRARDAIRNVVLEDPVMRDLFEKISRSQYEALQQILSTAPPEESAAKVVSTMHAIAQQGLDASPTKAMRQCCKGCSYCCYIVVGVLPSEAIAIAEYVRQELPPEQREQIVQRLRDTVAKVSKMTLKEHRETNVRCSLLADDGTCSVYPVRPIECRGHTSVSVEKCKVAYDDPTNDEDDIPEEVFPKVCSTAVGVAYRIAMDERGIDKRSYELNAAVLRAIESQNASRRWRHKEQLFNGCQVISDNRVPRSIAMQDSSRALGRNDPCPCGSGRKYKNCCLRMR